MADPEHSSDPADSSRPRARYRSKGVSLPGDPDAHPAPAPEGSRDQDVGLRRLLDLSRHLTSGLDREELLDSILSAVCSLDVADRAVLVLQHGDQLQIVRESNSEEFDESKRRISETLARRCLERNETQLYSNLADNPELRSRSSIADLGLRSAICIPLREEGQAFGVLYLDSAHLMWERATPHSQLLEAFAAHAAVCLVHCRILQEESEARYKLDRENEELRAEALGVWQGEGLIGHAPRWLEILETAKLVKDVDNPVLLLGESGTGKEEVARLIHSHGPRAKTGAFVSFDCAAIPESLMEAQLFGVRKGAYTDAIEDRAGFVERAEGGTLFLDEIGDLAPSLQAKLLRFLDTHEFVRVGETTPRRANVRIISATSRDLVTLKDSGEFRQDLFYRLNGIPLEVPSLRDRKEDVPLFVERFFEMAREKLPRKIEAPTSAAIELLLGHEWQGNVRELKQVVTGACALVRSGEALDVSHLDHYLRLWRRSEAPAGVSRAGGDAEGTDGTLQEALAHTERRCLERALDRRRWRVIDVASDLGISRQHVYNLIRSHGLVKPTE